MAAGVLLLFCLQSGCAALAPSEEDLARELMRASGMEEQLVSFAPGVEQQFLAGAANASAEEKAQISEVIRESFDARTMQSAVLAHLQSKIQPVEAAETLDWLRTPLGTRITSLEKAASTPEAIAELQSYAATLAAAPPDPERVALLQRMDVATRGTELGAEIMVMMARAGALASLGPAPEPGAVEELDAAIAAQRPAVQQSAAGLTLLTYLYSYRDLTNEDLGAYVAFLESGAGNWYQQATGDSLLLALRGSAERLREGLSRLDPSTEPGAPETAI